MSRVTFRNQDRITGKNNYQQQGVNDFATNALCVLQNIQKLRMVISHPLRNSEQFIKMAQKLNGMNKLKVIDIISQGDPQQDDHPNWTYTVTKEKYVRKYYVISKIQIQQGQIIPQNYQNLIKIQNYQNHQNYLNGSKYTQIIKQIPKLKLWECRQLAISQISHIPKLIQYLIHTNFSKLTQLYIDKCSVDTVQYLFKIYAPLLQNLSLQQNMITSVSSLKKINFTSLENINIKQNFIIDVNSLSDIYSEKLIKYRFGICNNNMNVLAKLKILTRKNSFDDRIVVSRKQIIKQNKKLNSLRSKFKGKFLLL